MPKTLYSNLNFAIVWFLLFVEAVIGNIVSPELGIIFGDANDYLLAADAALGTRYLIYSLSVATLPLFIFIGSLFLSNLSDVLGRKKILLVGFMGIGFGYLLTVIGLTYKMITIFILGRIVSGLFDIIIPVAQAVVIDCSTEHNKIFNLRYAPVMSAIGFIMGTWLGGHLTYLNMTDARSAFVMALLLSIIGVLITSVTFKESHHATHASYWQHFIHSQRRLIKALFDRKIIFFAVLVFLWQGPWAFYLQYLPIYLAQHYQGSIATIGNFIALVGISNIIALMFISKFFLNYFKANVTFIIGLLCLIVGLLSLYFFDQELVLKISLFPIAIGAGLAVPATLTFFSNAVDEKMQGFAMGVAFAFYSLSSFAFGMMMGLIAAVNPLLPFLIAAGSVICGLLIFIYYICVG